MERIEHKQNYAKRFLSVFLALAMILTSFSLPTKVYAVNNPVTASSASGDAGYTAVTLSTTKSTGRFITLNDSTGMELSVGYGEGENEVNHLSSDVITEAILENSSPAVSLEAINAALGIEEPMQGGYTCLAEVTTNWELKKSGSATNPDLASSNLGNSASSGNDATTKGDQGAFFVTGDLTSSYVTNLTGGVYNVKVSITPVTLTYSDTALPETDPGSDRKGYVVTPGEDISVTFPVNVFDIESSVGKTIAVDKTNGIYTGTDLVLGDTAENAATDTLKVVGTSDPMSVTWSLADGASSYLYLNDGSESVTANTVNIKAKAATPSSVTDVKDSPAAVTATYTSGNFTIVQTYKVLVSSSAVSVALYDVDGDEGGEVQGDEVLTGSTITLSKGTTSKVWVLASQIGGNDPISTPGSVSISGSKTSVADATMDGAAMFFVVNAKAAGSTKLTVTVTGGTATQKAEAELTVNVVEDSISVDKAYVYLATGGDSKEVTATTAASSTVTWVGADSYGDLIDMGPVGGDTSTTKKLTITSVEGDTDSDSYGTTSVDAFVGNSSTLKTTVNVSVFGLLGKKSTSTTDYKDVVLAEDEDEKRIKATYKTSLAYVYSTKDGKAYAETEALKLTDGTDSYTTEVVWSSDENGYVEVKDGVLTPTGNGFGDTTITGTYTDTARGTGATVTVYLNVTVTDYSFTINRHNNVTLSSGSTAYTIVPSITVTTVGTGETATVDLDESYDDEGESVQTVVDTLSVSYEIATPTSWATGDTGSTAASITNGVISAGDHITKSSNPYTVTTNIGFKGSETALCALTNKTLESSEFSLFVIDGGDNITTPETGKAFYIPVTDESYTITVDDDVLVDLNYGTFNKGASGSDDIAIKTGVATVSISGKEITITPVSVGSFVLAIGDKGKGSITAFDSPAILSTYNINIIGLSETGATELNEDGNAYTTKLYMTGSDSSVTDELSLVSAYGDLIFDASASSTEEGTKTKVTWASDDSDITVAYKTTPADTDSTPEKYFTATVTAKAAGTAKITATITTYKADGTTKVNEESVVTALTVKDYTKVKVNDIPALYLEADGNTEMVEPALSSDIEEDVVWTFGTIAYTPTTKTEGEIYVNGSEPVDGTGMTIPAEVGVVKTNSDCNFTSVVVPVTAKLGSSTGKTIGTTNMTVYVATVPAILYYGSDTNKTDLTGADHTTPVVVMTNLATDGKGKAKNSNIKLSDLTSELFSFGDGWSWVSDTALSSLGSTGDEVGVEVKYEDSKTGYTTTQTINLELQTIRGLEVNLNAYSTAEDEDDKNQGSSSTISVDTSFTDVAVKRLGFVTTEKVDGNRETNEKATALNGLDGNGATATDIGAYLANYKSVCKISDNNFFTTSISGKSVEKVGDIRTGTPFDNSFTLNVSKTVTGKSTITISALGFAAKITVNNVAKLTQFGTPKFDSSVVRTGTGDYTKEYFVLYDGSDVSTALTITATNATKLTLSSSDKNVATVPSSVTGVAGTTTNTFTTTITAKNPGYAEITLTADDSVKSKTTIKFNVTQSVPSLIAMEMDRTVTYANETTEANVIETGFAGYGYEVDTMSIVSQKNAAGDAGTWFKLGSNGGVFYLTFTEAALASRPVDGTYTITMNVGTKNIIRDDTNTYKNFKGDQALELTVTVGTKSFAKGSFTAKQEGKAINLFYTNNAVTLVFTGKNSNLGTISLSDSNYRIVNEDATQNETKKTSSVTSPVNGLVYVALWNDVDSMSEINAAVKAKKISFTVTAPGYSTEISVPVTLKVNNKAPKIKLSTTSATIYKSLNADTGLSFATKITESNEYWISKRDFASVDLVDKKTGTSLTGTGGNFAIIPEGNDTDTNCFIVTASKNVAAGNVKAAIGVRDTAGNVWRAKDYVAKANLSIKVDAKTTKPSLAVSSKNISLTADKNLVTKETETIHVSLAGGTEMGDTAAKTLKLEGANAKSQAALSSLSVTKGVSGNYCVDAAVETGTDFSISLKNSSLAAGTYKFNVVATIGSQPAKPASITLKVLSAVTVKNKTKGSIDIMSGSPLIITPDIKGVSGELVDVHPKNGNSALFGVNLWDGKVYITSHKDRVYSTKQKYSMDIVYVIALNDNNNPDDRSEITVTAGKQISFKVKNGKMTATVTPSQPIISSGVTRALKVNAYHLNRNNQSVAGFVRNTVGGNVNGIAEIKQVNNQSKVKVEVGTVLYSDADDEDSSYGLVKVTPLNLKPGKTVSVKLQVYEYGMAKEAKPAVVTLKITAPK